MKEIKVIKRDGLKDDFNIDKIENAVRCAYEEYDGTAHTFYNHWNNGMKQAIINSIEDTGLKSIDIEKIQDIVVGVLGLWEKDVATAYQTYREDRTIEREKRSNLDKEIDGIVKGTSEENTANGNVDGSKIQSIRALVANVACRDHARRHSIPKKFRKKHRRELYIHDEHYFDLPFFNCCVADWPDMFKGGFDLGTTHIETPKSLETAVNVLTQVASHISSNTYGGTTFDKLVTELTSYAKMSLNKYREIGKLFVMPEKREEHAWYMLNREIEHSMQSLEYEIQTLMTSRGETPFLTLGIDVIDDNANEEDIKIQRLIAEAILHQRLGGLTGGVTPVFPKLVYQLKDGNNLMPTDPYYELFKLAVATSALRGYPDYTMTDKVVEITGSYKAPMGCRSFPDGFLENGKPKTSGRFNFGVISINLPRLAIKAKGDLVKFYEMLLEELNNAKELLMIRYDILKWVKAKQAPILYMSGAIARLEPEETIESLLKGNASASIGYVGLHNCLVALFKDGLKNGDSRIIDEGNNIMAYISNYCKGEKKKTGIGFSMYGTPAETLATKFCEQDIEDFGIIEGVNDNGYYENSFHYPSNTQISPFEKLDIESNFNYLSSGGVISFVELGDMTKNLEALEDLIRYAYDKTPFLGISTISDRCLKCGYVGEIYNRQNSDFDFECPNCGCTESMFLSVIRKLCGYLGSIAERPTASGKMKEIRNRIDNTFKGR